MFFEGVRSERQLMKLVADRLSLRWYLGYDLFERLPDHSSLTRIRERFGVAVFRRFFERIVEECVEAGLVRGKEMFFDATKVGANAAVDSLAPRWVVEAHLGDLFDGDESSDADEPEETTALPSSEDEELKAANAAAGSDWVSRGGEQDRNVRSGSYQRIVDTRASKTDPDATPMRYGGEKLGLGYHVHYVVDGAKSRVVLNALVTPSEVMEQQPMLDLLWRTAFRFRLLPRRVTGDTAYGTRANIAGLERAGIRAYVNLKERANPDRRFFSPSAFAYDEEQDLIRCPAGRELVPWNNGDARDGRRYKAKASVCAACSLKPECTPNKRGRTVFRHFEEGYVDRVRAYRETEPYHRALRKRKVWVEPLFAEAKDWHGMRRFRLRRLERVNAEALLIAAGQNVKRLPEFADRGPKKTATAAALRPSERSLLRPVRRHRTAQQGVSQQAGIPRLVRWGRAEKLIKTLLRARFRRGVYLVHENGRRRVAIYCRVSTSDQDCDRQERDLFAHAERAGYEVVGVYKETLSGIRKARGKQPLERARVMALAQRREIDAVLVTELTRWGRSTQDLMATLGELASWDASLIAQTGLTFDLSTPQGRLVTSLMTSLAEFEHELLRERVRSGIAAAKARGQKFGREKGYRPSDARAPEVLRLADEEKLSQRAIAARLGMSKTTVNAILGRRAEAAR
jgi:putative DNA-invertase from lambdoid prophage Rac